MAENDEAKTSYRYFNKNNGDVVESEHRHTRLEFLQNWVTVESDEHLQELQADNDRNGRGNLLGSSNVGDRIEPRHQVPYGTFEPKVEETEPSVNELPDSPHPDPEDYHKDREPEVITVDPSKQVQPIAGEGKRDLSAVVLEENMDLTPGSRPIGAGAEDGVLARAHPELTDETEKRRQQLISEQQGEQGDPDAGHTAVQERSANGDDASTKQGVTQGQEPNPENRPARTATKDRWVDWAIECGSSRSDAERMTKQDLIDIYG